MIDDQGNSSWMGEVCDSLDSNIYALDKSTWNEVGLFVLIAVSFA